MVRTEFKGVIFDLDGVITMTAKLHADSWEKMFNEFLHKVAERDKTPFLPFDPKDDYLNYVDGKPRFEGVLSFLKSRNIRMMPGTPDDPPDAETICGLGNKKNIVFQELLKKNGPEVFETSVEFVKALKERGIKVGIASSSKNCPLVLELGNIADLFETVVDGLVSEELALKGKPEPDIFTTAAQNLGLLPGECMVVEDAISGVQAGRAGNFGLTLGIARNVEGDLLKKFGADMVVTDLGEISPEDIDIWFESGIAHRTWYLTYFGFDPGDEKLRETLTAVGNGYLGTRGCLENEKASFVHYPGTYLAGVYNRVPTEIQGKDIYNNDFVNCPNWLSIEFRIGNQEFLSPLSMELISYAHTLDMRRGVTERAIICKDKLGRITRIFSKRLASMVNPHLCAVQYEITPCNYSDIITIRTTLDGNIINDGVARYRELTSSHLEFVDGGPTEQGVFLKVRTTASNYEVAMEQKTLVRESGKLMDIPKRARINKAEVSEEVQVAAKENATYTVEKLVSVYTSLDEGVKYPDKAAAKELGRTKSFQGIFGPHSTAWKKLWDKVDVLVDGDRFIQQTIRLHIYHLLVSASPHNVHLDAGITARGLHGEAYRGHIFWDELYILPFYDNHFPEVGRALLMYRYNRLKEAKKYARENGCKGAMYPWQTCDTGAEETQEIHYNPESGKWDPDLSRRQRHVSIAVFYNTWRYVAGSGDTSFLRNCGAEMMLEIARFWASIAKLDKKTGKYHIDGVMGPDEFHEKLPGSDQPGVRDNAYTNVMVVWLMEKALKMLRSLPRETLAKLSKKIGFKMSETEKWQDMTTRLNVLMTKEGIIHQFDGYMDLKELNWDDYRKRYYSIHRMDRILKAEGDSPDKYKVAKQADTLMMFYVLSPEKVAAILRGLGHTVDDPIEMLRKNYDYYEKRTSHGSTLSKVVHAVVSSFIHQDSATTWEWFMESMRSDIYDTQGGTTIEGIHTGVMAGTTDVVMRDFGGVSLSNEGLSIDPALPDHWNRLRFRLCHKKVWYTLDFTQDMVRIQVEENVKTQVHVTVRGKEIVLRPGERREVRLHRTD